MTGDTSEQEHITLTEHMSSHPYFSGFRVAQFVVFCVMLCRSVFVLWSFFPFDHCVVSSEATSEYLCFIFKPFLGVKCM